MQVFKKYIALLAFFVVPGIESFAQSQHQIGFQLTASYYLGDMNETKHFMSPNTHIGWGIIHRAPMNDRFTWKNTFTFARISGEDSNSDSEIKRNRNLNFVSKVYEFSSQFEFNFFPYHPFVINHNFTPYAFVGFGLAWANPTSTLNGNEYTLRDYKTEGQASPYSKVQFVMPFGMGFKFKFSHRIMFSVEYGIRKTWTDYLDDISTTYPEDPSSMSTISQALSNRSLDNGNEQNEWGMQRGNSQRRDFYTITSFTMLVRLGKNPNLCRYNTQ